MKIAEGVTERQVRWLVIVGGTLTVLAIGWLYGIAQAAGTLGLTLLAVAYACVNSDKDAS